MCGRLEHTPRAVAESRLREHRRGDAQTGPPQSDHGSAARAWEAAAQTHSCGARAEAAAQLRRNLECGERRCGDGPPQSDRGSAATEMLNPHAREAAAQEVRRR